MKIAVTGVTESSEGTVVQFTCKSGSARGRWLGADPVVDEEYVVEFDCEDTLRNGTNATPTKATTPRIWQEGDRTKFTALVDDVFDENSTSILRLDDSVLLIDYEDMFFRVGAWIDVSVEELRLNDVRA